MQEGRDETRRQVTGGPTVPHPRPTHGDHDRTHQGADQRQDRADPAEWPRDDRAALRGAGQAGPETGVTRADEVPWGSGPCSGAKASERDITTDARARIVTPRPTSSR